MKFPLAGMILAAASCCRRHAPRTPPGKIPPFRNSPSIHSGQSRCQQLDARAGLGNRGRPLRSHLGRAPAGHPDERELAAAQNPPAAKCCFAAPPVLVFDQSGNLLRSWAGPAGLRVAAERARHFHRRQ